MYKNIALLAEVNAIPGWDALVPFSCTARLINLCYFSVFFKQKSDF